MQIQNKPLDFYNGGGNIYTLLDELCVRGGDL